MYQLDKITKCTHHEKTNCYGLRNFNKFWFVSHLISLSPPAFSTQAFSHHSLPKHSPSQASLPKHSQQAFSTQAFSATQIRINA
jgi:hypothetical protein